MSVNTHEGPCTYPLQIIDSKVGNRFTGDPIRTYIERYSDFEYDPTIPPARLFDNLVLQNRWPVGSPRFQMALSQFRAALFQQFDPSIEIPGPLFVESEPVPAVPAEISDSKAKKLRKKARRNKKKCEKILEVQVEGSGLPQVDQGVYTQSTSFQGVSKVEVYAEEVSWGFPRAVSSETRTVAPSMPQEEVTQRDVGQTAVSEVQNTGASSRPTPGSNSAKRKSRFRKNAAYYSGVVSVVPVPVGELGLDNETNANEAAGSSNPVSEAVSQPLPLPNESTSSEIDGNEPTPLDEFFNEYPDYNSTRDRTLSVATQFNKLRRHEEWWGPRHDLFVSGLKKYQKALVLQFNAAYGTDGEDLETWHRVLRVIGAKTLDTVDECKSLMGGLNVNLVDLVDASLDPVSRPVVLVFDSMRALSLYTVSTRKFFPKEHASAGGLLKYLLRVIF